MRALTFAGKRRVSVETVADPEIRDPSDALVAVRLAGICGSDLHVYNERERGLDVGTVMGHEFVGEVLEVGRQVRRFRPGDTVCSPFTTSCGECFYCRTGLTARCSHGALFGWIQDGHGLHGAQGERVRVPLADSTLVPVPADAAPERTLLLGDVLPTGWFAAELASLGPGMSCVVVGCGPVGLMAVLAAVEKGCEQVFALDLQPERVELARRFGAHRVDGIDAVRDATEGRGVDAVLEVVGAPEAFRSAFELVRPGGTIASVGVHTDPGYSISPAEAYDKNLTIRTGRCPARRYMEALLPLALDERRPIEAVVSHRLPLSEGARGYDIFDRKLDGCTKVVLRPPV